MFGFSSKTMPEGGPWSSLPVAPSPWQGSSQVWQPAQQAPWRMTPWQTQGMPMATPIPQAPTQAPAPSPYLSQGVSSDIPNFNPLTAGGGFYPLAQPAPEPTSQAGTGGMWAAGGSVYGDPVSAQRAMGGGVPVQVTQSLIDQNPALNAAIPGGYSNPAHPGNQRWNEMLGDLYQGGYDVGGY